MIEARLINDLKAHATYFSSVAAQTRAPVYKETFELAAKDCQAAADELTFWRNRDNRKQENPNASEEVTDEWLTEIGGVSFKDGASEDGFGWWEFLLPRQSGKDLTYLRIYKEGSSEEGKRAVSIRKQGLGDYGVLLPGATYHLKANFLLLLSALGISIKERV